MSETTHTSVTSAGFATLVPVADSLGLQNLHKNTPVYYVVKGAVPASWDVVENDLQEIAPNGTRVDLAGLVVGADNVYLILSPGTNVTVNIRHFV